MENHLFALIGKSLSHSFSPEFYNSYFLNHHLEDHQYITIEISQIADILSVVDSYPQLEGFNVTIPYKEQIIPFLHQISPTAKRIGAVNVVKVVKQNGQKCLYGYNTDYKGFDAMLKKVLKKVGTDKNALILGSGGASKCVQYVLSQKKISFWVVSRTKTENNLSYQELTDEMIQNCKIIINCTPLGMFPNVDQEPPINYEHIGSDHFLIDLVYNPEQTQFMKEGLLRSAEVMNGIKMLKVQAAESLKIFL